MIQIGEVPSAPLIGWVTSNNKWVGNNSNLLERWISKLYPNYVHIQVLKIQLWFSEGFQSTSESSGIAAGVGCWCFQGQLGEEGGRIVASFSSVFTREMGKPKLFIQHCSTWFSMVFPLTSFNISIVGFWGGFADESLFQGARTLGEDLSEATAAAGPGEIQVGCWALGIWAIEYHGLNEISWDLMGF